MSENEVNKKKEDETEVKESSFEIKTLESKKLVKSYKGRKVVSDVSYKIKSGEVVGLLGPNGAGKTTSFYMTLGLVLPDDGRVEYMGTEITNSPMSTRAKMGIGYLPQEASVFRSMTVKQNFEVALEATGCPAGEIQTRVEELLGEFQINHISSSLGKALSGGERRRVEIARALAGRPDFLLLDEPFAGIDPIAVSEIQKIVLSLKSKGLGILITDHNVRETLGICDRAYLLKAGEVVLEGSPEAILASKVARESYLGESFKM